MRFVHLFYKYLHSLFVIIYYITLKNFNGKMFLLANTEKIWCK